MTHTKMPRPNPIKAAERAALKDVRKAARAELAKSRPSLSSWRLDMYEIPAHQWEVAAYDITSPTGQNLGGRMTLREALLVETILGVDGWRCVRRPTAAQKRTAKAWAAADIGAN
jgi:hypothetical protein